MKNMTNITMFKILTSNSKFIEWRSMRNANKNIASAFIVGLVSGLWVCYILIENIEFIELWDSFRRRALLKFGQDVGFAEEEQLLLVPLQVDLGATELGEQDAIALLHANGNVTASVLRIWLDDQLRWLPVHR